MEESLSPTRELVPELGLLICNILSALISSYTSNFVSGVGVPIPTLPSKSIRIASDSTVDLLVENAKSEPYPPPELTP